jgi:glucosamine--fructose-6-phosphate aminotransferase (isomerizing)
MEEMEGTRGIVQLRWATFGVASVANSQPHFDCDGDLVGAHNGNIINTLQLQEEYRSQGHAIRGENDGEMVVHVLEKHFDAAGDMEKAILQSAKVLKGDYACVITGRHENRMFTVKMGSSLYLGVGDDFICCSSDLPSILEFTRRVVPLYDGEFVTFTPREFQIKDIHSGVEIPREVTESPLTIEAAHKGGFPHFMLKEIHDQADKAGALISFLKETPTADDFVRHLDKTRTLYLVGSGTSYHACLTGAYFMNKIAGRAAVPVLAGSFIESYGRCVREEDALVLVSQSGETKDIINVLNYCERIGKGNILSLVNVIGSTLMLRSQAYLPLVCDVEVSVPATKTFMNQLILMYYLAVKLAERQGIRKRYFSDRLHALPRLLGDCIAAVDEPCRALAESLAAEEDMYCLGFGINHGIALEGALKIKEVTYHHCEGMYSSEFKHGPLSIVRAGYPVIFVTVPEDAHMVISHINEVGCREGRIIVISRDDESLRKIARDFIPVPDADYILSPFLDTVPLQLLAYHIGVMKGIDPDFPRNISKTLTVD